MRVGMLGRKVGMTQIYETDGTAVPITKTDTPSPGLITD